MSLRLKKQYRDKCTGATGIATGRFVGIDGEVEEIRMENSDGHVRWYTASRLELVEKVKAPRKVKAKAPAAKRTRKAPAPAGTK